MESNCVEFGEGWAAIWVSEAQSKIESNSTLGANARGVLGVRPVLWRFDYRANVRGDRMNVLVGITRLKKVEDCPHSKIASDNTLLYITTMSWSGSSSLTLWLL